tara:strand:+ start:216 stop:1967 length:1752 start_codon:yes stop_codon:yes gene_type:complete
MKIIRTLFIASLLSLISTSLYAQDYYVCDTGNDENSGTSTFAPFKSVLRGLRAFNEMQGGDSVLFCRGGTFNIIPSSSLYNTKCSASNVCTIGAYGEGERPIIISKGNTRPAAIHFSDGGAPSKSGGYVVKDLILVSDGTTPYGVELINDVDDVLLDNLQIQGFGIGVYSAGSNAVTSSDVNGTNDRVTLRNSSIIDNGDQGWLGGGTDILIENNAFQNNGYSLAVFNHNIYINGSITSPTSGVIIRGNTLYKSAIVNGECKGVSLVGHGVMNNILIENNTIKEDEGKAGDGCWGIAIDAGYAQIEEEFNNLTIRNNTIINVGGLAIGCSSCVGVSIEGNTIVDPSGILYVGISVPNRGEDAVKSKDVTISGNRVLLNRLDNSGISVAGSNVFSVVNNSIEQPSSAYTACIKRASTNADTDISSNQCNKYVSFSDVYDGTNPVDTTPVDTTPVDTTPVDTTPVDAEPTVGIPKGEEPIDATPIHISSTGTSSTGTSSTGTSSTYASSSDTSPTHESSTDTSSTYASSSDTSPTHERSTDTSSTIVSAVYVSPKYSSLTNHAKSTKHVKSKCRALSSSGRCLMR